MACFLTIVWIIVTILLWAFDKELEFVRQMIRGWYGKIFKPAKKQMKVEIGQPK